MSGTEIIQAPVQSVAVYQSGGATVVVPDAESLVARQAVIDTAAERALAEIARTGAEAAEDGAGAARDVAIAAGVQYPSEAAAVAAIADGDFASYLDAEGNPVWGQRSGSSMVPLPGPWIDADKVGVTQSGVGAVERTAQAKLRDELHSADFGVVGSGTGDESAALQAAVNASATLGKTLVISGTPRITSQVTVPNFTSIRFDGAAGNQPNRKPKSYIIKGSAMTAAALSVTGESVYIQGGGVVAEVGNAGDNIEILNHSFRWDHGYSQGAGRDGIRIGEDGTATPNSNHFRLYGFSAFANGRDGIRVQDGTTPGAAPNANAGILLACFSQDNGGKGIYGGNSFGNTVESCLVQSNDEEGIYLDPLAQGWTIIGGDSEANRDGTTGCDLFLEDTDIACTFQDAGDTVTKAGHGLVNGTPIRFARINTTTGINVGTTYWVVNATTDTFQVAATSGGAALALTNDGAGVYFRIATHSTRGGHKVIGLHLGRLPYDGAFQTDQQWIIGQGFGAGSGTRPAYTEVTFTPTLGGATTPGTVTLSTAKGRAIKMGRMVTVHFDVIVSAFSGATGALRLGNLPFAGASGEPSGLSVSLVSHVTMPTSRPVLGAAVSGRNADFYGYGATDGTQFVSVNSAGQGANFASAGRISGVITYVSYD